MIDQYWTETSDPCPVCGGRMMQTLSAEFSNQDTIAGVDECVACGWRGVWTEDKIDLDFWKHIE